MAKRSSTIDLRDVASSFMRPSRVALDAARSAVAGVRGRGEAWERLYARGVIPDGFLPGGAARWFLREPWPAAGSITRGRLAELVGDAPDSVEAAVTISSDVPGVLAAEQLAAQLHAAASAITGMGRFAGVIWRVLPSVSKCWVRQWHEPFPYASNLSFELSRLIADGVDLATGEPCRGWRPQLHTEVEARVARETHDAGVAVLSSISRDFVSHHAGFGRLVFRLYDCISGHLRFAAAAEAGLSLPPKSDDFRWSALGADRHLSSIRDPFAPLLGVFGLGYAVYRLVSVDGDSYAVLCAVATDDAKMPDRSRCGLSRWQAGLGPS